MTTDVPPHATAIAPMGDNSDTSIKSHVLNLPHPQTIVKDDLSDHQRSFTSVMQGVTLNMNEPWERSLSRLLQEDSTTTTDQSNRLTTSAVPTNTSPTSTAHIGVVIAPELMLLGRTESRDFALEIEGSSTLMNLTMDDSTSCVVSIGSHSGGGGGGGCQSNCPIRSRRNISNSIYRTKFSTSKKQLAATSRKSLFDDDSDDEDDSKSEDGGMCRLTHKFSDESLFLFYDQQPLHQQHQQHEDFEDRCEQEDDSDRKCAEETGYERSFSICKASAIRDDDTDNDYEDYFYESQRLYIPEHPDRHQQRSLSSPDLYLPST